MLILTRKVGEKVIITIPPSQETQTVVVEIARDKPHKHTSVINPIGKKKTPEVRLGFVAPESIKIWREEIHNES